MLLRVGFDLHQHLWPEGLARRDAAPRLRRRGDRWGLPLDEAQPLLDIYHEGVLELGGPFRLWAAPAAGIDALLDRGALGACVPAGALAGEGGYGPRTVDAMLRVVGVDRLVYGSDRPVVAPPALDELGPSFAHAVREANPARLLSLDPVPA